MSEKYKGYQNYLLKIRDSGIKPFFRNLIKNNHKLLKLYLRLTNISTKRLSSIPNISNALRILDIGCGTGETLYYIKRFLNPEAKFFAVDLEKNPILPDFISFQKADIEQEILPFENGYFDIVVSNFVIEHLTNPSRLFSESFRVLKKGGFLYITTEYYTSLYCPDYWNFYSDHTHIRPWTKKSLKTLAQMSGFDVYKFGIIKWWEFLPLLPVFPLLNLIFKSNFSFIPFEILGRTVYIIAKKL